MLEQKKKGQVSLIWIVGQCDLCGTVVTLQRPDSTLRTMLGGREFYCPFCFTGRLKKLQPVRPDKLDLVYNKMRTEFILQRQGGINSNYATSYFKVSPNTPKDNKFPTDVSLTDISTTKKEDKRHGG